MIYPVSPNCIIYLGSHITHICNTSSESYDSMFCGTIDRSKFPWHQALDMREKQIKINLRQQNLPNSSKLLNYSISDPIQEAINMIIIAATTVWGQLQLLNNQLLTPVQDQDRISPYNIETISSRRVTE